MPNKKPEKNTPSRCPLHPSTTDDCDRMTQRLEALWELPLHGTAYDYAAAPGLQLLHRGIPFTDPTAVLYARLHASGRMTPEVAAQITGQPVSYFNPTLHPT